MTQFTRQDADAIIKAAQEAPLANMRHAQALSDIVGRFTKWYDEVSAEKPAKPGKTPKTPPAQGGQGSPDSQQPKDPAS